MTTLGQRGLAIVGLSTVWQAVGTVVLGRLLDSGTALFSTMVAFLGAAGLSVARARLRREPDPAWRLLRRRRPLLLLVGMNIATAGVFLSFFEALTLVPAVTVSVLEAGLAPLLVAIGCGIRDRRMPRPTQVVLTLVVAVTSSAIALGPLVSAGGVSASHILGLVLSGIAGVTGAAVVLLSAELRSSGVTAGAVNACRFHLAWIASAALWALTGAHLPGPAATGTIMLASIALAGLPLVALQTGLMLSRPLSAELVLSTLPALVFIGETVRGAGTTVASGVLMMVLLTAGAASLMAEARRGAADSAPPPLSKGVRHANPRD